MQKGGDLGYCLSPNVLEILGAIGDPRYNEYRDIKGRSIMSLQCIVQTLFTEIIIIVMVVKGAAVFLQMFPKEIFKCILNHLALNASKSFSSISALIL